MACIPVALPSFPLENIKESPAALKAAAGANALITAAAAAAAAASPG